MNLAQKLHRADDLAEAQKPSKRVVLTIEVTVLHSVDPGTSIDDAVSAAENATAPVVRDALKPLHVRSVSVTAAVVRWGR